MTLHTSYSCRTKDTANAFQSTTEIYRKAVDFFIDVCLQEWDSIQDLNSQERVNKVEAFTNKTKARPDVKYDFSVDFYKFPSYLRRAAIKKAIGHVSSYQSNLENWKAAGPETRGKEPGKPKAGNDCPVFYHNQMYERQSDYICSVKLYVKNDWVWVDIPLRKTDVKYIQRYCKDRVEQCPSLRKRGKVWSLDFPFEEKVSLCDVELFDTRILAVDLGIKNPCTCSVLQADGTVLGRAFYHEGSGAGEPAEPEGQHSMGCLYDRLNKELGHIRHAQSLGARHMPNLWAKAKGINDQIARKTAQFIIDTAICYNVDVIVFEHLDTSGKKHGSKKQRLHHWRAKYVQQMVADKAHRLKMHISHICAWNTSRLAFDGSGRVKRGKESEKANGNYSLCEFSTGKVYNCDLNASYNIGARYFIREILKSLPAKVGQAVEAKVPQSLKRSTCTLSVLKEMYATLCGPALLDGEDSAA